MLLSVSATRKQPNNNNSNRTDIPRREGIRLSKKYVIGCDFGTLSMRAILVGVEDGNILSEQVLNYRHGVITEKLPESGVPLRGPDWALQHPDDYLEALYTNIPALLNATGVNAEDIIAIGVDFTTCTVVPLAPDGEPLCKQPAFANRPHAWVKLWKNHTAHKEAEDITAYVEKTGSNLLDYYGGRTSSEFFFPKIWEILRKDEEVYHSADTFLEAGDFVVYKLCGNMVRSGVLAAAKGFHDNSAMAFPSPEFFRGLDPRLENIVTEKKLQGVVQVGSPAGTLTKAMAERLGLTTDTVVCSAHADAACTLPGAGIVEPHVMTYVMGTSTCHMMMTETFKKMPGACAVYYEGILPGYYCYEAGQSAVGDIFDWFCKQYLPPSYMEEARERGINIMQLMDEKAGKLAIGESGLIALDWMNGNRSILQDANLTGLIMGLTLATKPEEIFRALLEATGFGTRVIMDQFDACGLRIDKIFACGGLAQKSSVLMQIYSDIMGKPIQVSAVKQTSAMASALFASVAAGAEKGGHSDYRTAVKAMIPPPTVTYTPIAENTEKYAALYKIYRQMHDFMAQEENNPMKALRALQQSSC